MFGIRGFKVPTILNGSSTSSGTKQPTAAASTGGVSTIRIPAKTKPPWDRKRLIEKTKGLPIPNTESKLNTIHFELASKIDFRDARIAASVLIRLIVERSVAFYAAQKGVILRDNDSLHVRISKVAKKMKELKAITANQSNILRKMGNGEELLSANTLNSWIHDYSHIPTAREVAEFWDNIRFFLIECWK